MIQLSPSATNEILRLKAKQDSHSNLRIAVSSNGCLSFAYSMTFDSSLQPGDQLYGNDSVQIVVHSDALPYLSGLVIDYSEDMMGGGFRFHNPKASQVCGCGNSFLLFEK